MTQKLVIPNWLPPPVLNVSRQRHWAPVSREIREIVRLVYVSAIEARWKPIGRDAPRQRLTVVFVFPMRRRRDVDNLYARAKHCVDGIKPFLVDDDSEHLDLIVKAETVPGVKQTQLTLEPA